MRKQVISKCPSNLLFEWVNCLPPATEEVRALPAAKSRLDSPPSDDALLKAFKTKPMLGRGGSQPHRLRRILIVEDEEDLRLFYLNVLARDGYHVNAAEDGEAGWQALQAAGCAASGYDLLITDNKMPKLSGVELIEKVNAARMELPIILASGALPSNTDCLQVTAVLPKPFFMGDLLDIVHDILKDG
jgi:CheY-like chemotaxis protein